MASTYRTAEGLSVAEATNTSDLTLDGGEDELATPAPLRPGQVVAGGRLRVVRRLGAGGMGAVYEVFDHERRRNVALKTLHELDAAGIYQLKNEFRSLAEVYHPNLVGLHELFCDEQRWFFTMDLVADAERFDRWVRPGAELDEARLRSASWQLFDALSAIHQAGKLHRDVKPSNVLVSKTGKLTVLDFGLVVGDIAGTAGRTLTSGELLGTPRYMAPEQTLGQPATPASDYYALGVMIYEAISGASAYEGNVYDVLTAKQRLPSPRLSTFAPSVSDLAELCHALMAREPDARPGPSQIASVLARRESSRPRVDSTPPENGHERLLGRARELAALQEAYAATEHGRVVLMSVSGESGVGKTALCQTFLRKLSTNHHAVVLHARCYEQESVPFKGLDPLIDDLSRHMRRLRADQAAALLPRNAFALARLFPVLRRVAAFDDAPKRSIPEPRELRRLALEALCELLGRLRDRQPLVLYLDDLQWIDADSSSFLRQVLLHGEAVPLMFLTSHRLQEDTGNRFAVELIEAARVNPNLDLHTLTVRPLTAADTAALAQQLIGSLQNGAEICSAIADEARGNPYIAQELARAVRSIPTDDAAMAPAGPSVAELISLRTEGVTAAGRAVLQILALVACPLPIELLLETASADHADIDALRAQHLIRGSASVGHARVECYHDRLRDVVAASIEPARRIELYRALAASLSSRDYPELLSRCQEQIGERDRAAESALHAARRAASALAFERAVVWYRRALALGHETSTALLLELAEALENAGYGREAAATFEVLAAQAEGELRLDYQRRAALQLLETGDLDEGLALMCSVCRGLGLKLPRSDLASLLTRYRVGLQLRKLPALLAPRANATVSARQQLMLKAVRAAVTGVVNHLPVMTVGVASLYLREALRSGDVGDCVRALGFYAHMGSALDSSSIQAAALLARMAQLAAESQDSELLGFAQLMQGTSAYHREEMRAARDHFNQARTSLSACSGVEWERDAVNVYDQMSACYAGDYQDLVRTTPVRLDDALRRGRVWAATMLTGFSGMPAWLTADDAAGYRARLSEVCKLQKTRTPQNWQAYMVLCGESLLAIYVGDPRSGYDRLSAHYKPSLLVGKSSLVALGFATHRGRCAAAALGSVDRARAERRELLAGLSESISGLTHGRARSQAFAAQLRAAHSFHSDLPERAVTELRAAVQRMERAGLQMHLAATRKRLGELLGGEQGRELQQLGEAAMRAQGVKNIEAMTELNCPGFSR